MVTVFPKGTTIYKPEKCYNGYTLFAFPVRGKPGTLLIDMNGRIVKTWQVINSSHPMSGWTPRVRLLENGHVVILRGKMISKDGGIQEYDWDGKITWEYCPPSGYLGPHHDFFRENNGNTLLICREEVPEEYRKKAKDPERRDILYSDIILEVTPDKKILWEWHEYEYLDINLCNLIVARSDWYAGPNNNTITDWTHTNTVRVLPQNKWYDEEDERFKPGNVLLTLRQLDLVLIVDKDTKEIVWTYTGDYKGGLSGPHDAYMIEKGYPGEGNILIFDNGMSPYKDLTHVGCSFVLEVNPLSKKLVWKYEDRERFHSNYTSSVQRLPNGNTLINETAGIRIFEITPEGEIVWEYVYPKGVYTKGAATRAYRYPYDCSPQTKALGKPKEEPRIPPEDMLISPAEISAE